jgi:hypothetical protein
MSAAAAEPFTIPEDAVYPRDEANRYRIYARRGDALNVLATAGSPEALGVALVQLDSDAAEVGERLSDSGAIGVLDAVARRWIVLPWYRTEPGSLRRIR